MKTELLELLRGPTTGQHLTLEADGNNSQLIDVGWLVSEDGQHRYPIRNGIPRFVPQSNYADNFGMQWNHFRQIQLDSHSGLPISSDRFWLATNWTPADLKDQWVLDVGCGAGRFAEVALKAGAKLVALDYSMLIRLLPTRKSAIISWSCQPNFHFRHHFRNSCDFSRMTRRVQCIWKASAGQTASSVMVAVGRVSQTALLTAPPLCFVAAIANVTRRSPLARSCNARTHQCRSGFGLPTSCRAKRRA